MDDPPDRSGRRRGVVLALALVAFVAAFLVLVRLLLGLIVDAEFVEARADDALGRGSEALTLDVGSVELSPLGRSLRATDVLLHAREPSAGPVEGDPSARPADSEGGGTPRGEPGAGAHVSADRRIERTRLRVDSVLVKDLRWTRLVLRRELRAEAIRLIRPRLQLALGKAPGGGRGTVSGSGSVPTGSGSGRPPAAASESGTLPAGPETSGGHHPGAAPFPAAVVTRFPGLRVGALEVRDGTVVLLGPEGEERRRDAFLFQGIDGALRDVRMDSTAARDSSRLAFGRPGRFSLERFRRETADGLNRLEVGPVAVDPGRGLLTARALRLGPPMDDDAFLRRLRYRRERIRLSLDRLEARGVDVPAFLRRGDLAARGVELEGFDVDVFSHKGLPKEPDPPDPPDAGHLPELDRLLRADTVRLAGRASYAEAPGSGAPIGRVSFEEIRATGYGVTNRGAVGVTDGPYPAREPEGGPVVVEARARVYGATPVHVTFRLRPGPGKFRLSYRGGSGAVDLPTFDALLVPLEGVKLRGRVDTVAFRVEAAGDTATGTVRATYRDLSLDFVDRESGEGTFLGPIKRLFVNLNTNNYPGRDGDPVQTGAVTHRVEPDDELLEIVWEALRSGLMSLVEE